MSGSRKSPAVFLDRDNTIIPNDGDLGDPEAVELLQGAAMAVASLCGLGFKVVVVTNQGGVARGKYTEADVDAVHDRLREMVQSAANGAQIEAFYFCPFHPKGTVPQYTREHEDRKPRPGMLRRAATDHGLDLERSWMVGDQLRDVQAGLSAGCRTVLLDAEASHESADDSQGPVTPDFTARTLVEAVRIIASQRHAREESATPTRSTGRRFDAQAMAELQKPLPTPAPDPGDSESATEPDPGSAKPPAAARPFRPFELPPKEPPETSDPPEFSGSAEAQARAEAPKLRLAQMVEKVRAVSGIARETPVLQNAPAQTEETQGAASASGEQAPQPAPVADALATGAPKPEHGEPAVSSSPPPSVSATHDAPEKSAGLLPADAKEQQGEAPGLASSPPNTPDSQDVPETATLRTAPEKTSAPAPTPDPGDQKLLRLILQELRGQRGGNGETGPVMLMAMVFQAIAGVALLAGLWTGAGDDGVFLRWLGVALVVQLGVIALLLFGRAGR